MRAVWTMKIYTLIGSVCPKHTIFRWKSTEGLCLMKMKSDAKFKGKLSFGSKNDMRNLVNFNVSSGKSGNLHFDVLLLPITYKFSALKVQKNYFSRHWKKTQTLKKNWLFIWKLILGIWWTLPWAVESLKNCTFVESI